MKKGKVFLYLVALATVFCVFTHLSINTKANSTIRDNSPVQVGCTETSITFDFNSTFEEMRNGYPNLKMFNAMCSYGKYGETKKTISNISFTNGRYTITGLEPGERYECYFGFSVDFDNGEGGESASTAAFSVVGYTYKDISNTVNVRGVTATTITVDILDVVKAYKNRYSGVRGIGIAEIKNDPKAAMAQARNMAAQRNRRLDTNQVVYTFTKLKPNTPYYISIGVLTQNPSEKEKLELTEATLVTTASIDKASIDDEEENQADYKTNDAKYPVKTINDNGYESAINRFGFNVTGNTMKISIKEADNFVISPCSKTGKISVGYAEESTFNPRESYYPDDKKALEMVETGKYSFKNGENEYTITGLTPGKTYTIILKANIRYTQNKTGQDHHFIKRGIKVGYDSEADKKRIESSIKKGYEFDIVKIHRGEHSDTAYLDWTDAKNQFIKQKVLAPYLAEYGYDNSQAWISYFPIPDDVTNKSWVENAYNIAKYQFWRNGGNQIPVDTSKSRLRIYGLDRNKKYVFIIRFHYRYFVNHVEILKTDEFYCDESGMNMYNPARVFADNSDSNKKEDENKPSEGNNKEKKAENPSQKGEKQEALDGQYATFSQSTEKVSLKKLKKKAQKVTVTVDNSKGKITVKNKSSKKLKDYLKITVKNRKITAKLKKGAKKGTYKFQVKVAADGSTKETVKTIKIVVK